MRQIFFDTETTGFNYKDGARIIEFGAVEAIDRKLTGNYLHLYFKPDIEIEVGAQRVHGISMEQLQDKKTLEYHIEEIIDFIKDSELIAHNGNAFDFPFLNSEIDRFVSKKCNTLDNYCTLIDSLVLARKAHPGQKNSLDALCKRYYVDNSNRNYHGAILDSTLLAKVYIAMTGGQSNLVLSSASNDIKIGDSGEFQDPNIIISPTDSEIDAHKAFCDKYF